VLMIAFVLILLSTAIGLIVSVSRDGNIKF